MKYLNSIIIALCLIAVPVTFTGCKTPESQQQLVFYTFKDIQTVTHKAFEVFSERVVRGEVSANDKRQVEEAYAKYQAAFRLAFLNAQKDYSKLTPAEVQILADQLIRLIYKL